MKKLFSVIVSTTAIATLAACAPNTASTGASTDPQYDRERSARDAAARDPATANQGGQAGTQAPGTQAAGSPGQPGSMGNPGAGGQPHSGSGAGR